MNLRDKFQTSRFLKVDGAFNFRCVGGYSSTLFPDAAVREGFIYRAGHLGDITSDGWHTVKSLGVSTVIDLTSPGEVEIFTGAPQTKLRPAGIEILRLPFRKGGFSLGSQVRKYQVYRNAGPEAIAEGYLDLMEAGLPTIRRVLELFRDNVGGGFLIHCTLGKDRTGLIVGLLLSLAGVPQDTIAEDFSLSEAHIEHLQPRLADIVESIDPNEEDAAAIAKMATECRREVLGLTLRYVDERYGGISKYAQEHCGFSAGEIDRIRQNMLTP